jgi:multidrug transporter EmrE-like cation transporter
MKVALYKADSIGALASSLCLLHCLATPFLFMAQSHLAHHSDTTPYWWQVIDLIFLAISFLALNQSTKSSTSKPIRYSLWISWFFLCTLIINEKMALYPLPEVALYVVAILLTSLHLYNLKYCQCQSENCSNCHG